MKWQFKYTYGDSFTSDSEQCVMTIQEESLPEILDGMTRLLKAAGFVVDGQMLQLVDDLELLEALTWTKDDLQLKLPLGTEYE